MALHLFFSWLLTGAVFVFTPPVFDGDAETARNYLNTIATILATIFTLSISIVMVAIQMTASKYTHRILDFYVRFPYNISLFSFYLLTIFHAIYMLSKMRELDNGLVSKQMDKWISADLVMLIVGFVWLLVYMYAVMKLMKPETIIGKIEKEYLISYNRGEYQEALSKIEQIADIGKRAVNDMDTMTAVRCVKNIADMLHNTRLPTAEQDKVLWYHKRIVEQLQGLASISFSQRETVVSGAILREMFEMGIKYVESGSLKAAGVIVEGYTMIVINSLAGQQQLNMIATVVSHIYDICCEVVRKGTDKEAVHGFVISAFHNLQEIGRQVIKSELHGHSFVARHVVSNAFGRLLAAIIEKDGPIFPHPLIYELFYEYVKLTKILFDSGDLKDVLTITTWMREEMLPNMGDRGVIHPYLYLFMLLSSTALYLQRKPVVTVLIRAIGKYFEPDAELLDQMNANRLDIRHLYDYQEPERYLTEVFLLWEGYYRYARKFPEGPKHALDVASRLLKNQGEWIDLFDGLSPGDFLPTET
ncbi:DUF2254 family protein [Effusibacillus lacus]|uniref:DUF2254 domain-containing protein n=1 Tax=Effusibacillus lacus TaxID=1348429 RepID=A0A292YPP6_9BACL|nr:DUF2254 family protein [Effusibacillus lacus]TCS76512.1 putative membrane protein DUF2254 [Effusibacillus lacus]GAX90465.1 hypothetical protein EFBL_2092 [Effusibacillus lacus]